MKHTLQTEHLTSRQNIYGIWLLWIFFSEMCANITM